MTRKPVYYKGVEKLTFEQFVETYSHSPLDDEMFAEVIVEHLPDDSPLVRVARAFLDACRAFDSAMEAAGIARD